jgi:hypothetical protein
MNNRWCIIAHPRTGSNYLEDMLFWNMHNQKKFTIRLGELMHRTIWSYADSTGYLFKKDVLYNTDVRKKFTQDLFARLSINPEFGAVLRFFVQTHYMPDINYKLVIDQLKSLNFKFIHLTRNMFDSTISLSMAQHTDVWHRREKNNKEVIDGNAEYATAPSIIELPLSLFGKTYMDLQFHQHYTAQLLKDLDYTTIRYENMIGDSIINSIPLDVNSKVKKTYGIAYKDIISNYKELETFYGQLSNG